MFSEERHWPLGLLLKYFSTSLLYFPPLRSFYYNKIRTNILFSKLSASWPLSSKTKTMPMTITLYSCLPSHCFSANSPFWPLACFSDWFHKYDSHTIWESKKSNLKQNCSLYPGEPIVARGLLVETVFYFFETFELIIFLTLKTIFYIYFFFNFSYYFFQTFFKTFFQLFFKLFFPTF